MSILEDITQQPPSSPDQFILAASLLSDSDLDDIFDTPSKPNGLRTGIKSVDDALGGAFGREEGAVVGISGERGVGKTGLSLSLVTSLLLHPPSSASCAAIIDTTGNFDVFRIYTFLLLRLQSDAELLNQLRKGEEMESVEDVAAKVLERVKIMRVFDFEGLMEAVEEVREELNGGSKSKNIHQEATIIATPVQEEDEPKVVKPTRKEVIGDSEDEDDDDDMLFNCNTDAKPIVTPPPPNPEPAEQEKQEQDEAPISFVLINDISSAITPMMKNNYVQASTLLATFLRILAHLTHTHGLTTILLNPAYPIRPTPAQQPPAQNKEPSDYNNPNPYPAPHPQEPPPRPPQQQQLISIFASNAVHPALYTILPQFLDLHLLVSRLPKRKRDAQAFYGQIMSRNAAGTGGAEMVSVVEVISDRWDGRVGQWGVFTTSPSSGSLEEVRL
ncbi:hypothetical protein GQ43DRAFT_441887 [Delitschia confertaspora ATCC 74209]|uniref:DNA recombination and repair protein Rad51-like C-terminal domain-containing protein n=1 Tax=Delitschia confertaspora ATCC 74209 TaxID=1513339 RepID=A0A9P4JIR6_9PLEO|nr:hypothetical protein GQ43DRAFT_441887 [Delitschia confertaspora ATCC 74209]